MAGGKETPRQKMIGMMYLVLTALLALNVSKQVIAAFITLNDKLDASSEIIGNKVDATYGGFDQKRAALVATKGDMKLLETWQGKAEELKAETAVIVGFLLGECNEMIKMADGVDWVEEKDEAGNITSLKSLHDVQAFDNYDIPTNLFVGGEPKSPNERGMAIPGKIHEYRNKVCELMGNYQSGKKTFTFTAPEDPSGLAAALATANEADTSKIASYYRALTLPEHLHGHDGEMPWVAVMFDHAPIVAAAAMLTSLKLDIKNAESVASEYMLSKVEAPTFNFNKIEPLAFARTGYINQGDSLDLSVMIAAYDSNEVSKIRYGIDADTIPDNWKEVTGKIALDGSTSGLHIVKGTIGVKEKGEISWKPWKFQYTVGQPMGVVAQPEMRILYWGYNNIVEGTASGYDPSSVTLSGSGVSLSSKGAGQYVAKVSRGTRTAKISVSAKNADGGSVSLGAFDFECRPMPPATVYFGKTQMGGKSSYTAAKNQSGIRVGYDPSVPLKGVTFSISGGIVKVDGIPGTGKVNSGGKFDSKAKSLLKQSKNKQVTIVVDYKGPDGIGKKGGVSFSVK
jgi:GldM N-terminal domain/GldM third domain/GldM second domain